MRIAELIQGLSIELVGGSPQTEVCAIVEDSRVASSGCLFVAREGLRTDGREYVDDAVRRGAVAVLSQSQVIGGGHHAVLRTSVPEAVAARMAERFHGEPSANLRLIGVTGTNGKSTVAHLIRTMLSGAGVRCGLIGTVEIHDGLATMGATYTTPPATETSRLLAGMVANQCRAAVIEVSSHALQQHRVSGLTFEIAVFTNLTGDHLDYHETTEVYRAAKSRLFAMPGAGGACIINADDSSAGFMVQASTGRVVATSLTDSTAEWFAEIHDLALAATAVRFRGAGCTMDVDLPLVGRHNVCNALQAAAVCVEIGVEPDQLPQLLAECTPPPGRLEPVRADDADITVLVDYAHTDDALTNALGAIKPLLAPNAGLHVVFGCGGDRDQSKRPRMARAAARFADDIVITSDNPRTEDPHRIIADIMAGAPPTCRRKFNVEVDRRRAIEAVVAKARSGDVVVVAGKGHETYQIVGSTSHPFDDRVVAAQAIDRRLGGKTP